LVSSLAILVPVTYAPAFLRGSYNPLSKPGRSDVPTPHLPVLDVFDNPHPDREYDIEHVCPEFTSVCPITGQPDFATIRVQYVPDRHCVELKSLKLYLWKFRDEGHFYEDVTNLILDDLVSAMDPIRIQVIGEFNVRGGIRSTVRVAHQKAR
jgi:7-cyano-7-deazaguanine reductase